MSALRSGLALLLFIAWVLTVCRARWISFRRVTHLTKPIDAFLKEMRFWAVALLGTIATGVIVRWLIP